MRAAHVRSAEAGGTLSSHLRVIGGAAACALAAVILVGCGGASQAHGTRVASRHGAGAGSGTSAKASDVRIVITPSGGSDSRPDRGLEVTTTGGTLTSVRASAGGKTVAGAMNRHHTAWHSTWALGVSERYTVTASATAPSGQPVTRTASFHTFTPKQTFVTETIEGYHQTYGVGMPIILYFNHTITNRSAIERALQVKSSAPVTGSWYWDDACGTAPTCLYFRPRHYWPADTRVSFVAHLNGVQGAPGVYGFHTLTQSFDIGQKVTVSASTTSHHMTVYRNGRVFAHWPISTGRPGDDTPNGNYLTIDKGNPVDMKGPGYNIEVPWSVRFTWSGDYLHDAYWSVGEQGFTNVSHGCVNMPPADAEIFYKMAVPGDPVTITGSPRAGVFDNGWTMWFLPWKRWLHGSALHAAVHVTSAGSTFFHPSVTS
ncbi:MAG TPA: Ig-like domain-containing protein [Solirubrobacteraceae bacterium]|nr:Ig-like domain-containing protein [Solirubrobacteraceae bacterium]